VRTKLGLSVNDLALELGQVPSTVEAWEAGRIKLPSRIAKELVWRSSVWDRLRALEQSGLPECAWVTSWNAEPEPEKLKERTARLERLSAHHGACEVCQARVRFEQERFGNLPRRPMPLWLEAFAAVGDRVERWPRWTQPAAWMGLAFGAYSLVQIVLRISAIRADPKGWVTALLGLTASVTIGALVGLGYGVFRALKERWRKRST